MINDIVKKLKYSRLKPEERYLYDLTFSITTVDEKYKNIIFYENKDNKVLFHYDIPFDLWVDYSIWKKLYGDFNLNDNDIKTLINNIFLTHFNITTVKSINPY